MVTKLKNQIVTKLKKSNCDKTQKLKLRQNSKTQIVIVVIVKVVTVAVVTLVIETSYSKNNLTPLQLMKSLWGSFSRFLQCFGLLITIISSNIFWASLISRPWPLPGAALQTQM